MFLFERFSRSIALIAACIFLASALRLAAQDPIRTAAQVPVIDASDLHHPTSFDQGWLVQAGDNPAWADPNYDDSHWFRFNARTDSLHTLFSDRRPDVVWYRLHIEVASHDTDLAIEEWLLGSAFEIYSNGVRILKVGSVSPYSAYDYGAHLLARIPRDQIAAGNIVIAVRVHVSPTEWEQSYPGLYYQNLTFGMEDGLREHMWLSFIGAHALDTIDALLVLGMIVGGVLLYSEQRRPEYLFLVLGFTASALLEPLALYGAFHAFPAWWHVLDSLAKLFVVYLIGRTYLAFVAWPVGPRMNALLVFTGLAMSVDTTLAWMNISTGVIHILAFVPFVATFGVVLPVILISAMRRGNRDAGILLLPLLLTSFVQLVFLVLFGLEQIPALRVSANTLLARLSSITAGPFSVSPDIVAGILSVLSLALIILMRSNRQSRQQAMLENEMTSAREVQQVILPEATESVPGFRVESVYEPAQHLGGDFFQVLPDSRGGMIVVVGDVAGKGLPAALLVSVMVGAIRTAVAFTHAPAEILAQLNDRLIGRSQGGFSTAIVAHLAADGSVAIANAGHLGPYLDGREIELPGALPLGIDPKATYETHAFALVPGSRLVFYSDGVVEAQNTNGELLGFARAAELSTKRVTEIAASAKSFGQSDDITVVAIAREPAKADTAWAG